MCKGAGGQSTQNQTSSVNIPPEVLDQYRQVWGKAKDAASQPFQDYTGSFVAPVNQTQQGGINNITGSGGWIPGTYQNAANTLSAGVAGAQPSYAAAGDLYGRASGLAGSVPGSVNAQSIQQYMSPYTHNVVDATTAWLNQQNKQQQNDLTTNAITSGAFGGDRSGIASGVLSGQQNMANASTISGLYNQNYAQALAAAQQQQGVNLQTAGVMGNLAQGETGLGQARFNTDAAAAQGFNQFGGDAFNRQLQQGQAQLGAGQVQQQTEQANLSALYNQFLMKQAYPFQTTQFLANIAGGLGPSYGSTTTAQGSSYQPQPFFSDDKLKENVHEIGRTKNGLKIVRYTFKDDPHKLLRIGFLASDVEKKMPEAVTKHAGVRAVDYDRAARASGGGLVSNDNAYEGFAKGGETTTGLDPTVMAAILAAQKAMYPGAAGRPGIGDSSGPHGMQLHPSAGREPAKAPLLDMRAPQQSSELSQAVKTGSDLAKTGEGAAAIYGTGKDALVGSAAKGTAGSPGYTPASGGLVGTGGKWDYDKGWLGRNVGTSTGTTAGVAPVPANDTITTAPLPDVAATAPVDVPPMDYFAARGGRMRRAAGGSSGYIPYASGAGYVPDEDYMPISRTPLGEQQTGMKMQSDKNSSGSGGGGLLGNLSSLASLGKSASGLAGMFGGAGMLGADALPMSGLGAMTGDAAMGAAGMFGAADAAGGAGAAMELLPLLLLKRGGRAGYEAGGSPDTYGASDDPDATNVIPFRAREEPKAAGLVVPQREVLNPERPAFRRYKDMADASVEPVDPAAEVQAAARAEPPVATAGVAPTPAAISAPSNFREPGMQEPPPAPTASGNFPRMLQQESGQHQFYPPGHEKAGQIVTSSAGARGIAQVMPDTAPIAAKLAGLPWNPELFNRPATGDRAKDEEARQYNLALGKAYYDEQLRTFGDPNIASAAYNAGPGAVQKALQQAKETGRSYLSFLPKETQDYVRIVGGGPAVALNAGLPGAAAGAAAPANAGVAPAAAPKDRDFLDRTGDWLDRNERHIIPALAFLGNMLASPSRTLAGSIGSGIAGGASALAQQQQIGQGQQRIDITQRSQWMSQWAQLRQIYNTQIANSGQADPQLTAQMHQLERMIGMSPADAVAGGGNSPAGGPSAGVVPTGGPSGAGVVPPATAPPAASPTPISGQPLPSPGNAPVPMPVPPGQPADVPPSEKLPTVDFPPGFLSQLAGTANPIEMRRRAAEMTDPGQAAALRQRADQLQADIIRNGGGQGNNGFVPLPSAGAYKQSQERIGDNVAWATAQQPVFQQRQVMRNSIEHIAKAVETLEPGAFSQLKADVQAAVKGAPIVGFKPPNTATMNAEEYQTFIKNARNVIVGNATGDQKTDAARQILAEGFADPHLQPKAVRRILSQALGNLDAADDYYRDVTGTLQRVPHLDRSLRANEFNEKHPIEGYYQKHEKDIAVRGDLPDKFARDDVGRAYIMTPEEMLQRFPKNADVTLPQIKDKWFDGKSGPRRFRIGPDGRPVPDGR